MRGRQRKRPSGTVCRTGRHGRRASDTAAGGGCGRPHWMHLIFFFSSFLSLHYIVFTIHVIIHMSSIGLIRELIT